MTWHVRSRFWLPLQRLGLVSAAGYSPYMRPNIPSPHVGPRVHAQTPRGAVRQRPASRQREKQIECQQIVNEFAWRNA